MPRTARKRSDSGYLHLIVRGNNRQVLFEEDEDYKFFIKRMGRSCREAGILLSAYCLMENHVHMLVNDPEHAVGTMMRSLGGSYSKYYNGKYERSGHVFQGRYLSETVDDERYLLTVFRYMQYENYASQTKQPELMIQVGTYNLYIGSGVSEATLSTVLRVISRV